MHIKCIKVYIEHEELGRKCRLLHKV